MAKPEALAKVDADLERGHTHLAAQRLNSLIAAAPDDLALRARLAAVHRRTGNSAEAGRWGYLTEDVTAAEITAFEKAYRRCAADQLHALTLRGEWPRGLGPIATDRFAALTSRAAIPVTVRAPVPARAPAAVPAPVRAAGREPAFTDPDAFGFFLLGMVVMGAVIGIMISVL